MELLKRSTFNELTKLYARKKTIGLLLVALLLPFAGLPVVRQLQTGLGVAGIASDQYAVTILNVMTLFVLPLLIFMTASDMVSGEIGDKTIRSVLSRPVSRTKIYAAKLIALFAHTAVLLALVFVASEAAAFLLPDAGRATGSMGEAVLAYAASALPLFVLCTAAAWVSLGFKNASGALTVCILLYAAAKGLALVFPSYMVFSPITYMNWHQLWLGGSIPAGRIFAVSSLLLGCGMVFYTTGHYFFDKKEA
ncbi:ABC transporter permease [Cohnella rhizosphaerae]|uniref:ABC transporter permease n=1 Tax=Cohnella rhizosphaerae TaxID=1457232 RepID=A0A9X4QR40_9BACL|nr:ABC transporter permease [Cohnella rhizosphaerae]MDG0808646.1 ABC transporter permease [Cohnella rhizosphaerae]